MYLQNKKDPLKIETSRQSLALKRDYEKLKKTYDLEFGVFDRNKPKFWDNLLARSVNFDRQDSMTKDRVKTALGFLPKGAFRILDVGAGYGFIEEIFQRKQRKIFICGIDISPLGVRRLSLRFKGEFKIGDIRQIPYPSNEFDAVFALEVLEHIPPKDTFVALKELKRVLKRKGILVISVPTNELINDFLKNPSGHLRVYSPELIRAELSLAGFKFLEWKKLFAFNKFYKLKSILANLIPQKFQPNNVVIKARKPAEA